ncbi:MAG: 50S ribosomal protein L1 [Candidatus Hydrothermarchaeota archaeon]|nr:MAG: 50S ribosomal protein L1 [Candidatus Hydrothermarchaeota archaeon]
MDINKIVKAVKEAKEKSKKRNFVQSIDLAVTLNLDTTKPENRINDEIVLPHGRGKPIKIGVIGEGELAHQAKSLADIVITKKELEELAKDKRKAKEIAKAYDFFIAQADLMPLVGKYLGIILGPRGKMPKPVPPTADIKPIIERLRKTVRVRTKDKPVFHVPVGTEKMKEEEVAKNIEAIFNYLERKLERGLSDVKSAYISTTMGKSVKLEV